MSFTIERNGFLTFKSLVNDFAYHLKLAGFEAYNVDGVRTDDVSNIEQRAVFYSTSDIDPLPTQKWALVFYYSEEEQYLDVYICTPDQVIDAEGDFRVAVKYNSGKIVRISGKLTPGSEDAVTIGSGDDAKRVALRFMSFENWEIPNSDTQANPMSYRLVTSNHGCSFQCWVESYDSSGDRFAWFVVQRMIDSNGNPVVTGKAPLFCLFANKGYEIEDDGTANPNAVHKFVVRESDVHSPTVPVSALADTADSARIINGAQQVSVREGNSIVMVFPNDLGTQRYKYPHQLDMIGVISADVLSQGTEVNIPLFLESTPRRYLGMNADKENNRGIRLLFWVSGGSLT